jgi:hypothetical protein
MVDLRLTNYAGKAAAVAALSLWLGACHSLDFSQMNAPKFDTSALFVPDPTQFAPKQDGSKPVTAADLVDGNGYCAASGAPPAPSQTSESGADASAAVPGISASGRNVALQMSECEVVSSMGRPGDVQIAANERGDRMVTMTYMTPERPIYRFIGGRLATIERGAEPPPPEPVKKKKPAPKRNTRQAT